MITGFNTNIRYRGRMFHVQTEDSGRNHPHVISHIYYQGSILGSQKSDYAQRVGSDDLDIQVRALMERQHRDMVEKLKGGEFDAVISERLDGAAAPPPETPPPPARQAPAPPPPARAKAETPRADAGDKPLDEVILDYLVQKSRSRGNPPGRRSKE